MSAFSTNRDLSLEVIIPSAATNTRLTPTCVPACLIAVKNFSYRNLALLQELAAFHVSAVVER